MNTTSRPKLLLVQPGGFGDIITCLPIAKWYYDKGYTVVYPTREKFESLFKCIPYVHHIRLEGSDIHPDWLTSDTVKALSLPTRFDLVLNLSDRGPHSTAQLPSEKIQETKYRLSGVPYKEQYNLIWDRDFEKEETIYSMHVKDTSFAFASTESSHGKENVMFNSKYPLVYNSTPKGYSIFDWYKVLISAKEIYCIESAMHCFCEGIRGGITSDKFLLPRLWGNFKGRLTVSYKWDMRYFN